MRRKESYTQAVVYKPSEALIQSKIDLMAINKQELENLAKNPTQYIINRLDLIDRLLTQLHKKSHRCWNTNDFS